MTTYFKGARKMTKTMKQFIKENKTELFNRILRIHKDLVGRITSMNQKEIRVMIINEPTLTDWARSEGVVIA
jgi:hypothetical protein